MAETEVFQHAGRTRSAKIYLPIQYSSVRKWPVILTFHGGGSNAAAHDIMTGLAGVTRDAGFVLVIPNGTGPLDNPNEDQFDLTRILTWNASDCCGYAKTQNVDDVEFVKQLMTRLRSRLQLDTNRVYACGFSNGSLFSYRLAHSFPLRGVVGVGAKSPRTFKSILAPATAVLHIHGKLDASAPFDGGYGVSHEFNELSMVEHMQKWCSSNKCDYNWSTSQNMSGVATRVKFKLKATQGPVRTEYIVLYQGGHTWPGGNMPWVPGTTTPYTENQVGKLIPEIKASQEIVNFFTAV